MSCAVECFKKASPDPPDLQPLRRCNTADHFLRSAQATPLRLLARLFSPSLQTIQHMREVVQLQRALEDNLALGDYVEAMVLCVDCERCVKPLTDLVCMAQIAETLKALRHDISANLEEMQRALCRCVGTVYWPFGVFVSVSKVQRALFRCLGLRILGYLVCLCLSQRCSVRCSGVWVCESWGIWCVCACLKGAACAVQAGTRLRVLACLLSFGVVCEGRMCERILDQRGRSADT